MDYKKRRLALLSLIALELFVAALILGRVLRPPTLTSGLPVTSAAAPEATPRPQRVRIAPNLPAGLDNAIRAWVGQQPEPWLTVESGPADLAVGWRKERGARPLAEVVLVPVVPFYSMRGDVGLEELQAAWQQGEPRLLASPEVVPALEAVLGAPGDEAAATLVPAGEVADRLWAEPGALAVVPFHQLEPRLKALAVDGVSALDRSPELDDYALAVTVWANGEKEPLQALAAAIEARGLDSNRHADQMTVLLMTGVTALTRGVALEIEARGDAAWPARRVADLLAAADLTHVSNEVSFMAGCQPQAEMRSFCARPEYMATLRLAGVDVVELTGNHNLDYGPRPALTSLELYTAEGMATFGGGRNEAEARQPLLIEHNGNRLAFLGYNQFGPDYAWANDDGPGAARFTLEAVQADLAAVLPRADVVFVNVQHTESYTAVPLPQQVADFRAVIDAGAGIVTGSQAHQPQAIEFRAGRPIFYGLGNLFFDQTWSEATRQGLIVRHWIHAGRLLASEPIPILLEDGYQPQPAAEQEAVAILQSVWAASGW